MSESHSETRSLDESAANAHVNRRILSAADRAKIEAFLAECRDAQRDGTLPQRWRDAELGRTLPERGTEPGVEW